MSTPFDPADAIEVPPDQAPPPGDDDVPPLVDQLLECSHGLSWEKIDDGFLPPAKGTQDSAVQSRIDMRREDISHVLRRDQAHPVELNDLLRRDFPPRAWLLRGLLQERDLSMVHAFRGVGKSRFAHGVAIAVASGGRFLRYEASAPRSVLLVDGELPREDLQQMLTQAVAASDKKPVAPMHVLSADLADAPLLSLVNDAGRQQVEAHLDGVCLLVMDAVTTLCPGAGPENDAESWESMQTWLLRLRRRGVTVLLVHHDGKSGSQRGTSKREDVLSQVVQLRRPGGYRASEGPRFEVHLTKARAVTGEGAEPFEAYLKMDDHENLKWTWRPLEDTPATTAAILAREGMSQRAIARELGTSLATVNRALQRNRNKKDGGT